MIKVHHIDGRNCPMVMCDICHCRIIDGADGNVVWDGALSPSPVYHVHKGKCDRQLEAEINEVGGVHQWEALDIHLYYLIINAGMSLESLHETAERARLLGELI